MLFNSMHFAIYFLVVVASFFAFPVRWRSALILVASYYFYLCWEPVYLVLILAVTLVTWLGALGIAGTERPELRKLILWGVLTVTLGVLFAFKYFNFLMESLVAVLRYFQSPMELPLLHVLLPVGISFYTFQGIGYVVDVYRGDIPAERSLGRFALYLVFFPQLVAGPIERAERLLPQMRLDRPWDTARVWDGLCLMFWGLFKKVIIADRLAIYVDAVYNNVPHHSGLSYAVATYFFAFQIYCDFSGYSDIAVGAARILGVDLMENFRRPYFATTIPEFWRRWHISLSTWLRDYLYIPLGGNRRGVVRMYAALMITMLLGGIWHGANWTFVIWGALQGVMLCLSKASLRYRDAVIARLGLPETPVRVFRVLVTFHLVCLSWVFFRANSVSDALHILTHLFSDISGLFVDGMVMYHAIPALILLLAVQALQTRGPVRRRVGAWPAPARLGLYVTAAFSIILFSVDFGSQFIYFQF